MLTLLRHRRKAFRETYLSEDNFEESGTPASWAVIGGSVDFDVLRNNDYGRSPRKGFEKVYSFECIGKLQYQETIYEK